MGKTVRLIVSVAVAVAVLVITKNPQLAFAAFSITNAITSALFAPKAPPPDTAEGAIKTSRPARVSAYGRRRLYGAYILYETAADGTAADAYAVHDGRIDAVEQYYLADDPVTLVGNTVQEGDDKRYKGGAVKIYTTLGADVGAAIGGLTALLPGKWTANHRGDGVVIMAVTWKSVKEKVFSETYPAGQPVAASLVARWQLVYDWRDEAQDVDDPATWQWSENAVLHLAHYKLVREKAAKQPGEINPSAEALADAWALFFAPTIAYWTAAADDCDLEMNLKGGGTEPRYRSCVAHKHTDPHKAVTGALVACFDGWIAPRSDGALVVYSGRYYEPTVTIGPDAIVSYSWKSGVDDEDVVNEIPLTYVSAEHDFNTVDTTAFIDEADILARGTARSEPLENQVPSASQARRLAKRKHAQAMAPFRGTVTTNYRGRIVRGERFIDLHLEEAGAVFYSGPAEIVALTRNLESGGVTFTWIAADPNIDDWDEMTEEGDPAAAGDRVPPTALFAGVIAAFGNTSDGRVSLQVEVPAREDLTVYTRWRAAGDESWNEQTYTEPPADGAITIETAVVPAGVEIEAQVTYSVGDGRVADWSDSEVITTAAPDIIYDGGGVVLDEPI